MNILNRLALFIIYIYQKTLSPDKGLLSYRLSGTVCTHEPHCSEYAKQCFQKYPFHKALVYTTERVMTCTPSHTIKHDPSTYRVVFASGSPIGVPFLQQLMDDPHFDVVGVMCSPDKAVGRGHKVRENIIKKSYKEKKKNPPLTPPLLKEEKDTFFDVHENESYIKENKLISNGRHLPYNPILKERAKELRKNMTQEEKKLRKNYLQKHEYNVLRQKPIDHYIVDFYIPSQKLVIEIDGSQHYTNEGLVYDNIRDETLSRYGLKIIRISNKKINNARKESINKIESLLNTSSPSLVKRGLGGDLDIMQPYSLRLTSKKYADEAKITHERLEDLKPDFLVVVAYGYILPQSILDIPTIAPINVHGSLLPKYRGASPIQSVFLDHETETGITIMLMSAGMDEGDMITKLKTKLPLDRTATDLMHRIMEHGPSHLNKTLRDYGKQLVSATPQDDKKATHCGKIAKEDGLVDPRSDSLIDIYAKYQAYAMRPKIYFIYNDKRVIIESIELTGSDRSLLDTHICISKDNTLHTSIKNIMVKPEGKKAMGWEDFVRGWIDR